MHLFVLIFIFVLNFLQSTYILLEGLALDEAGLQIESCSSGVFVFVLVLLLVLGFGFSFVFIFTFIHHTLFLDLNDSRDPKNWTWVSSRAWFTDHLSSHCHFWQTFSVVEHFGVWVTVIADGGLGLVVLMSVQHGQISIDQQLLRKTFLGIYEKKKLVKTA